MKKLISLCLCTVLLVALAVPASAAEQFTYIETVYSSLIIDTTWGIASCTGYAYDENGVLAEAGTATDYENFY